MVRIHWKCGTNFSESEFSVFDLVEECKLELSQSDIKRIVNQLPIVDGLACLDYLLRNLWEGIEYDQDPALYKSIQG